MNVKQICAIGAIAAVAPCIALAGDWKGNATLGYSSTDIDSVSDNLNTTSLDLHGIYTSGNGFIVDMDAGLSKSEMSGTEIDVQLNYVMLEGSYTISNGFGVGGYLERFSASDDTFMSVDQSMNSYGLSLGYNTGNLRADVYFGESTTDPSLPSGVDVRDAGIRAAYSAGDKMAVHGTVARTRISDGGTDVDVDMVGLGGSIAISDSLTAFSGIQRVSLDIADADATTFGLGVAYQVKGLGIGTTPTLSVELARTTLDLGGVSEDMDSVRIGVSFPLGKSAASAPLNSVSSAVANGGHSALASGLLGMF